MSEVDVGHPAPWRLAQQSLYCMGRDDGEGLAERKFIGASDQQVGGCYNSEMGAIRPPLSPTSETDRQPGVSMG